MRIVRKIRIIRKSRQDYIFVYAPLKKLKSTKNRKKKESTSNGI